MNAEWLQSLFVAIALVGFFLIGLGGGGYFYFGKKLLAEKDAKIATKETALNVQLSNLQKINEELRLSIRTFEPQPAQLVQLAPPKLKPNPVKATQEHYGSSQILKAAHPEASHYTLTGAHPAAKTSATERPATVAPVAELLDPAAKNDRKLGSYQRSKIQTILRRHGDKKITINSVAGNEEAYRLADTIKHIFVEAGWQVNGVHRVIYMKPPVGLRLSTGNFPSPMELVATYDALTAVGFHVSQQLDSSLKEGQTELIFGINKRNGE
jgi:hypothetical protein